MSKRSIQKFTFVLATLCIVACNAEVEHIAEDVIYEYEDEICLEVGFTLLQQIERGDFSHFHVLEDGEILFASLDEMLADVYENVGRFYEWVEADVNGDGVNELILQAREGYWDEKRRIASIYVFDFKAQEVNRVFQHNAGIARFWFLAANGNVVHFSSSYTQTEIAYTYIRYLFDEEWSMTQTHLLEISYAHLSASGEVRFFAENEGANERRFREAFEEMTGFPFIYVQPEWLQNRTTFTTTKRIHESMPYFTFVRTLGDFVDMPHMVDEERHISIAIFDENGNLIQEIGGIIQGGHGWWVVADVDFFELQFDDFNFDGYLDMWLFTAINPGTASGAWADFWLWCPEIGQFVKNERLSQISEMAWLQTNHESRQITVDMRGGGSGPWATDYFEYIEGDFVRVAYVFTEWVWRDFVPSFMMTTRRNLVTGVVVYESDPEGSLPDYTVIKTVNINPYMEFPTHDVRLEMWRLPYDSEYRVGGYQYEIAITITGQRRYESGVWQSWQTIRGLRAGYGEGRWIDIDPENPLNLHFIDLNGDGYLDMTLRRFPPQTGNMADDPHYF